MVPQRPSDDTSHDRAWFAIEEAGEGVGEPHLKESGVVLRIKGFEAYRV